MNALLFVLINGFLFSVSSSSVTTNNSTNPSPVIQEDCQDKKPIPYVQPEFPQQQNNGSTQNGEQGFKPAPPTVTCADSNAC